jgi:hypothetical protein
MEMIGDLKMYLSEVASVCPTIYSRFYFPN